MVPVGSAAGRTGPSGAPAASIRAAVGAADPATHRQAANRAERGQRLAPEAEAVDVEQVRAVDLGGGVARQRQRQVGGGNAAAVVADPDQRRLPPSAIRDLDPAGARIERVLDQFLDRGGGPLDHLAGGDAVDRGLVELPDRANGLPLSWGSRHSYPKV